VAAVAADKVVQADQEALVVKFSRNQTFLSTAAQSQSRLEQGADQRITVVLVACNGLAPPLLQMEVQLVVDHLAQTAHPIHSLELQ
jgi:hypothetical protein